MLLGHDACRPTKYTVVMNAMRQLSVLQTPGRAVFPVAFGVEWSHMAMDSHLAVSTCDSLQGQSIYLLVQSPPDQSPSDWATRNFEAGRLLQKPSYHSDEQRLPTSAWWVQTTKELKSVSGKMELKKKRSFLGYKIILGYKKILEPKHIFS